jgi:NAD(P)-dependent dehydrogenase (short-subunit alcohol dehydrogenase family)
MANDISGDKPVVLITGATDGLGRAAALLMAERGYRIFAAGRSSERRAELATLAREKKLPLEALQMDVCDDSSVRLAVAEVLVKAGKIDVLINNAGVVIAATVEDMTMEDWRKQFETNFYGMIRVTQAVLPHMRQRRKGRIVMMSSVAGLVTPPTYGPYSASKHALEAVSNALRHELYPFGIKTILIEPGYIVTGIQKAAAELSQQYQEKMASGPYAKIYYAAQAARNSTRSASGTTPEDCARIILRAVEAKNPKARYGVTPLATLVKWSKRMLPDSLQDALIRRSTGLTSEVVREISNENPLGAKAESSRAD